VDGFDLTFSAPKSVSSFLATVNQNGVPVTNLASGARAQSHVA
jgi:hypothetical protein